MLEVQSFHFVESREATIPRPNANCRWREARETCGSEFPLRSERPSE